MDYFDFKGTPTGTITVSPPGGTGGHHKGGHHGAPGPLPTDDFPSPIPKLLHATKAGHTTLWVVFAIFTIGLIGLWPMALRVEKRARFFHGVSAGVLTIAMVSYLAMATGLGTTFVPIHNHAADASVYKYFREVYFARYIDWLFTTPLLLLSLAVLAGLSPADTVLVICADVFMIVTGLLGGLVPARWATGERSRWTWFTVSCIGFLVIWYVLITGGLRASKHRPSKTRGLFVLLSIMTFILWAAYPVVFALTEGANMVSVNTEVIAYAVLDVSAKVGFTYMLLLVHTHGEDDTWTLPEWFVTHRHGHGSDGRGGYGAIGNDD
ncbi:hypothetical protein BD324DRAFT_577895 [Kockovaella imperatae]|uniref:Uncharacterized protein n=1 Tax=Kockovaella imperatae TaxID=4999 RepID=A0A1Y1UJB4_9TREE|nr:hypothetical protein BD324DRAFT_577895 [Kockovaella imperatae]ORX38160.1 hypothetical protein BD324DRAFT_577895 [Kockovaella imperatae]